MTSPSDESASALSSSLPSALSSLRRPETANTADFWFCSEETWNGWLDEAQQLATKRNAISRLRKFDLAGRIMETDEGVAAPAPCAWCTREGLAVPCKVFANRSDKACAYCKRHGKSGCSAASPPSPAEEDLSATVRSLEARVATLEQQLLTVQEGLIVQQQSIVDLQKSWDNLHALGLSLRKWIVWLAENGSNWRNDITRLWNHVFSEQRVLEPVIVINDE